MTNQDYEQKKHECWEEFKRTNLDGEVQWQPVNRYDVFCAAFDRAYALGREKEIISQDEIDKAAEDYVSFKKGGKCILSYIIDRACRRAFKGGANFALGKQEKDAEGEELLTCEKSKAMQLYSHLLDLVENERISEHYSEWCDLEREYIALFGENVFADYFGTKCLPDEDAHEDNFTSIEPKPSEPKFNLGDKAILKGYVCTITSIVYEQGKLVGYKIESPLLHGNATVPESYLEPYTAPVGTKDDTKDLTFTDDCKSQCKSPDRLRIAAMAMEGILSKGELAGPDEVTDMALIYADELIKKCEEGSTL